MDANDPSFPGINLNIKPGMAWAIYMDHGPKGPCGQSMRITCPHIEIAFFPSEAVMRDMVEWMGRDGSKKVLHCGVFGSWGTAELSLTN